MTNADAQAQRRRTWVIGGVALVLSAVVGLVARGPLGGISYVKDALWALGAVVLVIGLGRAGSVTGRRTFATAVALLQILLANPLAAALVFGLISKDPANPQAAENAWKSIVFPFQVVVFLLTVLAVIAIGVARAVPSPWNWAPAWVLVGSWGIGAASLALFASAPLGSPVATIGAWAGPIAAALGTAFLGAVVIGLGLGMTRAPVID